MRAGNLRTIQYQGSTHLMYTSVKEDKYRTRGNTAHKIINSSYVNTAALTRLDASIELDGHDAEMLDDGERFLQAAKITHASGSGSREGIEEAVLQEVDLASSKIVFEWRSLDHVPLGESCTGSYSRGDYL